MNKAHMKKRKAKTGWDQHEYIGREKGPYFTIRYSVYDLASKIEIKTRSKIDCSITIYKNTVDTLDIHIRSVCNHDLKCYLKEKLDVNDPYTNCFRKVFSTQAELWAFLEELVNYAKTYEPL